MNKLITNIKRQKLFIKRYLLFMLVVISLSMIPDFIKQNESFFTMNDNMFRLITVIIFSLILLIWILLGLIYPYMIGLKEKQKDKNMNLDLNIIGKGDIDSQILFIEQVNKIYKSPLFISIINSLKELKTIKKKMNNEQSR